MRRLRSVAAVLACLVVVGGCGRKKDERRGYDDDSQIGTGTDIVDGALAVPLRAARQAARPTAQGLCG